MSTTLFPTLVHMLRSRAEEADPVGSYVFLENGETPRPMSYRELDEQARRVAVRLTATGGKGERALILAQPGLEYLVAYFGCIYAGWIPVPTYPPNPRSAERDIPRLYGVMDDCSPRAILTTRMIHQLSRMLPPVAALLQRAATIAVDDLAEIDPDEWRDPQARGEDLALLQYTSGSVGEPKGVMVSHANLVHNVAINVGLGLEPSGAFVSWLPQYHDMGLIGGMFCPVYTGMPVYFMSPLDFLVKPSRWVRAISQFRGTATVAPNFAFSLVVRKTKEEDLARLDLSSLKIVWNGAEPIRAQVMDAFQRKFAPCGFRPEAFFPCYGLAESTLIAGGGKPSTLPVAINYSTEALGRGDAVPTTDDDSRVLVSCGGAVGGGLIRIVEPDSCHGLPERKVGEVWLQGPSVCQGYWGREELSRQTFRARITGEEDAGVWLRTGDLGFLDGGKLFIVARLKDLIIIRGVNHYPQDIELTVEESHPAIRRGCVTAFGVQLDDEERLVVVAEVERRVGDRRQEGGPVRPGSEHRQAQRRQTDEMELLGAASPEGELSMDQILDTIARRVTTQHEISPSWIVLVPAATVLKTPSGKIRRRATRDQLRAGTLPLIAERRVRG